MIDRKRTRNTSTIATAHVHYTLRNETSKSSSSPRSSSSTTKSRRLFGASTALTSLMSLSLSLSSLSSWSGSIVVAGQAYDPQSFRPSCANWKNECPPDAPLVVCVKDPCDEEDACPKGQGLTCHANYCGGCSAVCCVEKVFCPLDARLCPDGVTYVTRNHADDCAFFPCSTVDGDVNGDDDESATPSKGEEEDDDDDDDDSVVWCENDVRLCPDRTTEVVRDPHNDCAFFPCVDVDDNDDEDDDDDCESDAEQCSDGTLVYRDADRCCLFEPCPDLTLIGLIRKNVSDRLQCLFD